MHAAGSERIQKDDGEFTDDYRRCRPPPERDRHNQRKHVPDELERGQD